MAAAEGPDRRSPGRRSLLGVADGTLHALVSRNGDASGYWGIGMLCRLALTHDVRSVQLDLLAQRLRPASEGFGRLLARCHARLRRHLEVLGLEDRVEAATARISFEPTSRPHAASTRFRCTVAVADDRGIVFERSASGWCWPHDPSRESRRVSTDMPPY